MNKKTVLLSDDPAASDAFGGHKRIADAIYDLVSKENGGRAIALTGGWGTGKSTVVKFISQSFEREHKGNEIFIFDAWAHEGDPLRRVFLEQLVNHFIQCKWVSKEVWEAKLDELSKKKRVEDITSTPRLTITGILFAFSALFVPIGLSFLGSIETLSKLPKLSQEQIAFLGILLSSLPILVILASLIFAKIKYPKDSEKRSNVTKLLFNSTETTITSNSIESVEPTSIEFEKIFFELIREAFENLDRKLLLVIDNLDRIPIQDALRLWSTMRTFFESSLSESKRNKIWTLVPFDRSATKKLWNEKESENTEISDSFIEKTFQTEFKVPRPLLSDWIKFFENQLRIAFPDIDNEQIYKTRRIFGVIAVRGSSPTPRDIKLFVNRVAALYRQWGNEFELHEQALYIAVSYYHGWVPGRETAHLSHFLPKLESILRPQWEESITALHFNIERKKALQVMLGDDLRQALENGGQEIVNKHSSHEGIIHLISDIIEERAPEWQKHEPKLLGIAAYALNGLDWQNANHELDTVLSRLILETRKVDNWTDLDDEAGKGLGFLVSYKTDDQLLIKVIEVLSNSFPPSSEESSKEGGDRLLTSWINGMLEVLKAVRDSGREALLREYFRLGKSAQDYVMGVIVASGVEDDSLWAFLKPSCTPVDVIDELSEALTSRSDIPRIDSVCEVMLAVDENWPWLQFINNIQVHLQTPQAQPLGVEGGLRALLLIREGEPAVDNTLMSLVSSGWLYHHFFAAQQSQAQSVQDVISLVIAMFDPEGGSGSNPDQASSGRVAYQNSMNDTLLVQRVSDLAYQFTCGSKLVSTLLEKASNHPIGSKLLQFIAEKDLSFEAYSPEILIDSFEIINYVLNEDDLSKIVERSIHSARLVEELINRDFDVDNAEIYYQVLALSENHQKFKEFLINGLQSIDTDQWLACIQQDGVIISLVQFLLDQGNEINLGYQLENVLWQIGLGAIEGTSEVELTPEVCQTLIKALDDTERKTLARNLRDKMLKVNRDLEEVIVLFGDLVGSDCSILNEEADEIVRVLFYNMISRIHLSELSWIVHVLEHCPTLLENCPTESKKSFRSRIRGIASKEEIDEEVYVVIRKIGKLSSAKIPKRSSEDTEAEAG